MHCMSMSKDTKPFSHRIKLMNASASTSSVTVPCVLECITSCPLEFASDTWQVPHSNRGPWANVLWGGGNLPSTVSFVGSKGEVLYERSHGDRPQLLWKSINALLHPNDRAARKGFCHRGCRECDGAESEGTSFALLMLCFPIFFLMPVKIKNEKLYSPSSPISWVFWGQSSVFSCLRAEEKEEGAQRQSSTRDAHLSSGQLTGRETHTLCNHCLRCMSEGSLATSLKITALRNRALFPLARLLLKMSFKLEAEHRVKASPQERELPPFTSHHWQNKTSN